MSWTLTQTVHNSPGMGLPASGTHKWTISPWSAVTLDRVPLATVMTERQLYCGRTPPSPLGFASGTDYAFVLAGSSDVYGNPMWSKCAPCSWVLLMDAYDDGTTGTYTPPVGATQDFTASVLLRGASCTAKTGFAPGGDASWSGVPCTGQAASWLAYLDKTGGTAPDFFNGVIGAGMQWPSDEVTDPCGMTDGTPAFAYDYTAPDYYPFPLDLPTYYVSNRIQLTATGTFG
jgi:hypothetical protein